MRGFQTFICAILVGIGAAHVANAHSWYPKECCSNDDCMPADGISRDARGDTIVIVGRRRIWVPRGLVKRPSPDNRIHVCFGVDESNTLVAVCLFMPPAVQS
jgi:hypothetical protein